eukprot:gene6668-3884_t
MPQRPKATGVQNPTLDRVTLQRGDAPPRTFDWEEAAQDFDEKTLYPAVSVHSLGCRFEIC